MICASSGVSSLYDLRRFDQDRNNFDSALADFDTRDNCNSLTVQLFGKERFSKRSESESPDR